MRRLPRILKRRNNLADQGLRIRLKVSAIRIAMPQLKRGPPVRE